MTTDADAMVILANSIDLLSAALEHIAEKITPGGAPAPAQPPVPPSGPPSAPPGGVPKGEKTTQQKRGGLIWGQCKDHNVSVVQAAESAGLVGLDADARKWSDANQQHVLDAMRDWGWLS